jgi:hypothetical protein
MLIRFLNFAKQPAFAYFVLWSLGGLSSFMALRGLDGRLLGNASPNGFTSLLLYIFIGVTILHQAMIYIDVHLMESAPGKYEEDFGGWFNTPTEIFLRVLILLCVLVSAGKLLPVAEIVAHFDEEDGTLVTYLLLGLSPAQACIVLGSLLLFGTSVLWDLFARARRTTQPSVTGHNSFSRFFDDQLKVFLAFDAIAFVFWILIAFALAGRSGPLPEVAKIAIIFYFVAFLFRAVLKWREIFKHDNQKAEH